MLSYLVWMFLSHTNNPFPYGQSLLPGGFKSQYFILSSIELILEKGLRTTLHNLYVYLSQFHDREEVNQDDLSFWPDLFPKEILFYVDHYPEKVHLMVSFLIYSYFGEQSTDKVDQIWKSFIHIRVGQCAQFLRSVLVDKQFTASEDSKVLETPLIGMVNIELSGSIVPLEITRLGDEIVTPFQELNCYLSPLE